MATIPLADEIGVPHEAIALLAIGLFACTDAAIRMAEGVLARERAYCRPIPE